MENFEIKLMSDLILIFDEYHAHIGHIIHRVKLLLFLIKYFTTETQ